MNSILAVIFLLSTVLTPVQRGPVTCTCTPMPPKGWRLVCRDADGPNVRTTIPCKPRGKRALAEARALLSEAGPLIGASAGWPGRRTAWLDANQL